MKGQIKALLSFACFVLLLLSLSSCQKVGQFHTHELKLQSSYRFEPTTALPLFADLRADGKPLLITAHAQGSGSYLLLQNLHGKAISQINIAEGKVSSLKAVTDPTDNSSWLFYSYNDGKNLYLNAAQYTWQLPLKREMKSFEPYPRDDYLMDVASYEWTAQIVPQFLDDIDDDGKLDLVCLAIDDYSVNPRGLMVFDFETGALNWFFRTPCNLTSLYFEDLDNDGTREFIFANLAHNNTIESLNGLDDFSGHIAIVDRHGKLLHLHKLFDGLGEAKLQVRDVDQDGILDIYARISTQGANTDSDMILRLSYASGQLKRIQELNLPNTLDFNAAINYLQRLDNSANYYLLINDNLQGLMLYDKHLVDITPRRVPNIKRILAIADIKQKGYKTIFALNNKDEIMVLNHNYKELSKLDKPFPDKQSPWLEVIDNGRGNKRQIAVISRQTLMLYTLDPIPVSSYIYRQLKAYYPLITLALLILLLYAILLIKRQRKGFVESINQLEEGLVLVTRKGKISYINKTGLKLILAHNPKADLQYLDDSLPALSNILKSFRSKWTEYEDSQVQIAGKTIRLHAEKLKGFRSRYLICMFSLTQDGQEQSLEWAETARRLSHHVRRHITNVLLALDPLESTENEAHKEYLEMAKGEIEKIRIFTHAFQRFTEMRDYELKLQDLVPSIEHALKQVRIPDNVNLVKNYKLNSIHARIEPIRFEEALINIINNATEAMPAGGNLQITIKEFPLHKSPKEGRSILVELEDSGKGIPAKYMEDIFKPFFTTNQFGTGIGIPETRKIIESMGGIFEIQSEEAVGTTVSLWLKGEHDD
ncbi:MAG: hypothetical protein LHW41_04570 [Candidatus Cloacimonetes bacterium]|nr:hypothetical protein [Candidatus Cloacimonadota bacterium]